MKLAIMQPYLFPYLGYFQLLAAVDKFVFLDDVNFIKRGWINRNSVLVAGRRHLFTVPLRDASQFVSIRDTMVDDRAYERWCDRFLKTMAQSYGKAPHYKPVREILEAVLVGFEGAIGRLAASSVLAVASYLGLRTMVVMSSALYGNTALKAEERLLDICTQEGAQSYYNAAGGRELYTRERFAEHGVDLKFVASKDIRYAQFGGKFVASLSIIDVLMFNPKETARRLLCEYELN